MDDLDDLLDDVEDDLNNIPKERRRSAGKSAVKQCGSQSAFEQEIDDLLVDMPITSSCKRDNSQAQSDQIPRKMASAEKRKCSNVLVGGTNVARGKSSSSSTCSNLRCTACDFKVMQVDDAAWHPSVDYLFLRNHMPDYHAVKGKLVSRPGSRAYACQCSWKSVDGPTPLTLRQLSSTLKWVCGKH